MTVRLLALVLLLHVASAAPAAAQRGVQRAVPTRSAGWKAYVAPADRAAGPAADSSSMVRMPPGWHLTTGPRTVYSDPYTGAAGRFRVESEAFLFPGPPSSWLGLMVGGRDLETPTPTALIFLLRLDGMAAVHALADGVPTIVADWTAAPGALVQQGDEAAKNVLQVAADADSLRFTVNGKPAVALPRAGYAVDGLTAFLASANLNAHITTLDITYPHAPPRARR